MKWKRISLVILLSVSVLTALLWFCTVSTEPLARHLPEYARTDLDDLRNKPRFTEDDYRTLFLQTGLGQTALDELRAATSDFKGEVLAYQELFFLDTKWSCSRISPITMEERIETPVRLAPLHDGDILITCCSHTFGWRNGHAALVTDADAGLVLEAGALGKPAREKSLEGWLTYPSFIVLRVRKITDEQAEAVVRYAKECLTGIPYDLTVGILKPKFYAGKKVAGTYCSHLVWQAYMQSDIDLEGDGGVLVTPADLADSPLLETVQLYGVDARRYAPR